MTLHHWVWICTHMLQSWAIVKPESVQPVCTYQIWCHVKVLSVQEWQWPCLLQRNPWHCLPISSYWRALLEVCLDGSVSLHLEWERTPTHFPLTGRTCHRSLRLQLHDLFLVPLSPHSIPCDAQPFQMHGSTKSHHSPLWFFSPHGLFGQYPSWKHAHTCLQPMIVLAICCHILMCFIMQRNITHTTKIASVIYGCIVTHHKKVCMYKQCVCAPSIGNEWAATSPRHNPLPISCAPHCSGSSARKMSSTWPHGKHSHQTYPYVWNRFMENTETCDSMVMCRIYTRCTEGSWYTQMHWWYNLNLIGSNIVYKFGPNGHWLSPKVEHYTYMSSYRLK